MNKDDLLIQLLKYPVLSTAAPLRILMRKNENGILEGYVENSFTMSWEKDFVYVYWSDSNRGIDAIDAAQVDLKIAAGTDIFDPLSEECPVIIDWDSWCNRPTRKYLSRNAPFKLK